jgi:hypothetical protein
MMNACDDCLDAESGQAMVEFALMVPLLVILLVGVVGVGVALIQAQQLSVAARHVARQTALGMVEQSLKKGGAASSVQVLASRSLAQSGARESGARMVGVRWQSLGGGGGFRAIDGHRAALVINKPGGISVGRGARRGAGIGVLYVGVGLEREQAGGTRLLNIGASAVMPLELPLTGTREMPGVMDANPWIRAIVNDKLDTRL